MHTPAPWLNSALAEFVTAIDEHEVSRAHPRTLAQRALLPNTNTPRFPGGVRRRRASI